MCGEGWQTCVCGGLANVCVGRVGKRVCGCVWRVGKRVWGGLANVCVEGWQTCVERVGNHTGTLEFRKE